MKITPKLGRHVKVKTLLWQLIKIYFKQGNKNVFAKTPPLDQSAPGLRDNRYDLEFVYHWGCDAVAIEMED